MEALVGMDSEGKVYNTVSEMWDAELAEKEADDKPKPKWYKKGVDYWADVDATVDGVLGGYGHVSQMDARDSHAFVREPLAERFAGRSPLVCVDCGAGVGRVTHTVLLEHFDEVDLVEPLQHFLDQARELLDPGKSKDGHVAAMARKGHRACRFLEVGLEDFEPEEGRYDVVWVQWCIGHLTDDDFVAFFARCAKSLKPGGLFFLKENTCGEGFIVDKADSSVTRSHEHFTALFERCDLDVVKTAVQKNFPRELYPVRMYLLEPRQGGAAAGKKAEPPSAAPSKKARTG